DATVLVRREEAVELVEAAESPETADDETILVPRVAATEDVDPLDEATVLAPRRPAEEEPPADATLRATPAPSLDEATAIVADAAPGRPAAAPLGGKRRAYSPGEEGVAKRVYSIRSEAPAPPIVRTAPAAAPFRAPVPQTRRR